MNLLNTHLVHRGVHIRKQLAKLATALCCTLLHLQFAQAADVTTSAPLRKLRDITIYSDPRFHCAFPSVVVRPDGELICAFRRAPSRKHLYGAPHDLHVDPNSYLVTVRSRDGGETWTSPPALLHAHPFGGSQDPCLLQLRNGDLLCASYGWAWLRPDQQKKLPRTPMADSFGFLGGYLLRSRDSGHTWSAPINPPPVDGTLGLSALGEPLPAYNRGALLERSDGTILWAVARHDSLAPGRTSVHLMQSADHGETWRSVSPIAADPTFSFNETSLIETTGGELLAFLRTEGLGGRAALARSSDGGQTFAPWQDMGFVGFPLQAIRLRDGRILLVYGYRIAPRGVRARLLTADLSDLATSPEIILRDDGGSGDLGYPWACELPDGRLLVVYYHNIADGPRHIAGTLLDVQ